MGRSSRVPRSRTAVQRMVRRGWDARSLAYRPRGTQDDTLGHTEADYRRWLGPVLRAIPPGQEVLDLGCGAGVPASRLLSKKFLVTGVDLSPVQVRRARLEVPDGIFRVADMTRVRFRRGRFAAIVSLYAIIHVPVEEQPRLFRAVHRWLAPEGLFIAILGAGWYTGVERGWLGSATPMYWSHADALTYRRWLAEAGFHVILQRRIPEAKAAHTLFVVRRSQDQTRSVSGRSRAPRDRAPSPPATSEARNEATKAAAK